LQCIEMSKGVFYIPTIGFSICPCWFDTSPQAFVNIDTSANNAATILHQRRMNRECRWINLL
jgi:hypothetical protein